MTSSIGGRPAMPPEDRKTEQFGLRLTPREAAFLERRMRAEGIEQRSRLLMACVGVALATVPPGRLLAILRNVVEDDIRRFG